jgi:hypothetical protein
LATHGSHITRGGQLSGMAAAFAGVETATSAIYVYVGERNPMHTD